MAIKNFQQAREVENMTHNKEIDQSFKADTELIQMSEFANKGIKTVIITEVHMFKSLAETWKIKKSRP